MKTHPAHQANQSRHVRLVSIDSTVRPGVRDVEQELAIIGSGEDCEVCLSSSKVDAAQAAIIRIGAAAYVCDLGGPGGTILDDRRIRYERLTGGSVLRVGPFGFRAELPDGAATEMPFGAFSLRDERTIGEVANREPVLLIGSDAACDVVLADPSIAPRHALIAWTTYGAVLRDLIGSLNVRRNGRHIRQTNLSDGDRIGIGPYELVFSCSTPVSGSPQIDAIDRTVDPSPEISGTSLSDILSRMSHAESPWPESIVSHAGAKSGATAQINTPTQLAVDLDEIEDELDADAGSTVEQDAESSASQQVAATGSTSPGDTSDTVIAARLKTVNEKSERLKARVAAAQNALDERAKKLWEGLSRERDRLSSYHTELQGKARKLLEAAMQKRQALYDRTSQAAAGEEIRNETTGRTEPVPPLIDQRDINRVFGGTFEPAAPTQENADATAAAAKPFTPDDAVLQPISATPISSAPIFNGADDSLDAQAAELATMVRAERTEVDATDARLEALRFDIERLRSHLVRAEDRHRVRRKELDDRFQTLRRAQQALTSEREALANRLRQVESREAVVNSSLTEAEQGREELTREGQQLASSRDEFEARRAELRQTLESERHRLQLRQSEMQRRAAELARMARERRQYIEEQLARQHSALEAREREIRAQRMAIEEAGRFELDRTAGELEQVLNTRLADIEREIQTRQSGISSWMDALSCGAADSSGEQPAHRSAATPNNGASESIAAQSAKSAVYDFSDAAVAAANAEKGRLTALQREIESLQDSIRGITHAAPSGPADASAGLPADRSRWPGALKARLSEKIASLRVQVSPELNRPLEPIPLEGEGS